MADLKGHTGAVTAAGLHHRPVPARIGRARDGTARVWNVGSSKPGERLHDLQIRRNFPRTGVFAHRAPTGRRSRFPERPRLAVRCHRQDRAGVGNPARRGGQVAALAFSPDGKRVAGAGEDQTLRIWEPGPGFRGDSRALLLGHTKPINAVAFSPDGLTVATASQDSTVRLWTLGRIRSSQRAVLTHPTEVGSISFLPDGKTLATACRDGMIRLWDITAINPTVRAEFTGLAGGARVLLALDAGTLVGVNDGTRVLNWDWRSGKVLSEWEVPGGPASGVALTADGRYLARGPASGSVELYRVAEKRA